MIKTKILLIHPQIRERAEHAPFGLLQIAAVSDALGHQVAVLDLNAHRIGLDAFRQEVRLDEWDVCGISALSSQYKYVKPLLPIIRKERPNTLIVGGGGCFSSQPREMLRWNKELDVIVVGEGENTWIELLDVVYSKRFSEVRGLAYRDEDGRVELTEPRPLIGMKDSGLFENLDDLPFPAWELAPVEIYLQNSQLPLCPETMRIGLRRISITHERGCPYQCRFCSHLLQSCSDMSRVYGRKIVGPNMRWQSAEYVVRHIKYLRQKYCVNFVSILDENFLVNTKRSLEFADLMEKEGLSGLVRFGVLGHANTVKPEVISKLKDVGLAYVSIGAESADQRVLNALKKNCKPEWIQNAFDTLIKYEVYPITTWMICSEDDLESILATIRFWKRNQITCKPFFETPYPGCKLYDDNKEKIIEQFLTDEEKEIVHNAKIKEDLEKAEEIKDKALESYVSSLGDATDLVVNLNPTFNDFEIVGLQELMLKQDERMITAWSKEKGRKNAEKREGEGSNF